MDITKQEAELKVEMDFVDGDTRSFSVANPKATIAAADIESLSSYIADNNLLIGDKNGAAFNRINKATRILKTKRYLDIQ